MPILDDVRNDLVNDSAALANTLRKSKILSSELGVTEFREWVDAELAGYADLSILPRYRRFPGTNIGTFAGPGALVRNAVLPTYGLHQVVKEYAENLVVHQGVGELEGMLEGESEGFERRWPNEYVLLSQEATKMANGFILVDAYQQIPRALIVGVLDNVKNKLLDFVLSLQEQSTSIGEQGQDHISAGDVRNLFQIHIHGDHNVVASGENVHQDVSLVSAGNVPSLLNHFRQLGIEREDLEDLEVMVKSEPESPSGSFGPGVNSWVGRMVMKAASGIWNVGLAAAPMILQQGLNRFYGL